MNERSFINRALEFVLSKFRKPQSLVEGQLNQTVQEGDDVKVYPEPWQQEAIQETLRTGKTAFRRRPDSL